MDIKQLSRYKLPDNPGVYFFKKGNKILYIGKATNLYDRVRSYFSNDLIKTRGPRIIDMVFKANNLDWIKTDSVLEALITEANLIKKHYPDYNVKEKDDKSFSYLVITEEPLPKVIVIRGRDLFKNKFIDNTLNENLPFKVKKFFGPFPSTAVLRQALRIVRKMFPFAEKNTFTKEKYNFYRQLGLAPDISTKEAEEKYNTNIKRIILLFEGKKKKLLRYLEKEMRSLSRKKEFEKAGEIRNKIFALNHIQDISLIKDDLIDFSNLKNKNDNLNSFENNNPFRIEAFDVAHLSGKESVGVMTVITDGEINKSQYRKFKLSPEIGNNDLKSLEEVLRRRFNHSEWQIPNLIVTDGGENQKNIAHKIVKELKINGIKIVSVIKNEKHKPKAIIADDNLSDLINIHKKSILLANNEAHRFAITYHRKLRQLKLK